MSLRIYNPSECVVFFKTKEQWGGLSNMAAGYPIRINGNLVRTSEAIYQACKFPHEPEIQKLIVAERSPLSAKSIAQENLDKQREDWLHVRVRVMRWSIRLKLFQNMESFGSLLQETGEKPIVELSYKDTFWGAKPYNGSLQGQNVLGRLLMELRQTYLQGEISGVLPPNVIHFLWCGGPILDLKGINPDGHV